MTLRPWPFAFALFFALSGVFLACSSTPAPASGEGCSADVACPLSPGRSYRACTSADGASCSFRASDGTSVACASCADCAAATTQMAGFCGNGAPGAPDGGTGPDGSAPSPDPSCATLLECLANNVPSAFAAALAAYGPSGACWHDPSTAQTCRDACRSSLAQYETSGQCCESDANCAASAPYCDPQKHACASCPYACCTAADCKDRGTCDAQTHACACASDAECTSPGASYCDPKTRACEACPFGCCGAKDCANQPGGGICDPTSHACVACETNADCGFLPFTPNVCDPKSHSCVDCVKDADCTNPLFPTGKYCNPAETCVECLNDGQCATGHCSATGFCVCLADGDCGGGGRTCHTASGVCDECAVDSQCGGTTPYCGTDKQGIKTCGQCATNAQCTGGTHCLDQICTTKECFTNDDCGTIAVCNSSGQCQIP